MRKLFLISKPNKGCWMLSEVHFSKDSIKIGIKDEEGNLRNILYKILVHVFDISLNSVQNKRDLEIITRIEATQK